MCVCVWCVCGQAKGGKKQANQTRKKKRCRQQACGAGRVLERPRTREMTGHRHDLSKPSFAEGFLYAHVVRRDKGTITPALVRINKKVALAVGESVTTRSRTRDVVLLQQGESSGLRHSHHHQPTATTNAPMTSPLCTKAVAEVWAWGF